VLEKFKPREFMAEKRNSIEDIMENKSLPMTSIME
jgi:hypothetical protein